MIKMNEGDIEKIIEMTISKSNKEYRSLKEQFEELRNDYIELARSEEQLQNNWNDLEIWLEEYWEQSQDVWFVKIINKMHELEGKNE